MKQITRTRLLTGMTLRFFLVVVFVLGGYNALIWARAHSDGTASVAMAPGIEAPAGAMTDPYRNAPGTDRVARARADGAAPAISAPGAAAQAASGAADAAQSAANAIAGGATISPNNLSSEAARAAESRAFREHEAQLARQGVNTSPWK